MYRSAVLLVTTLSVCVGFGAWASLPSRAQDGVSEPAPLGDPPRERIRHIAVICGSFSGSAQHAVWYWNSTTWMYRVLREKYGYGDDNIYFLYEDPTRASRQTDPGDKDRKVVIDGQTNLANFRTLMKHLAGYVREGDHVFFFMVGHAGHRGEDSWYNCVGEDLSSQEFASLLDTLKTRTIDCVFSPCQTEAFLTRSSRAGRVIMVSTRKDEVNSAGVAEAAIRGFEDKAFDLDRNGRLSFFEAYQSMVKEQTEWWGRRGMPQREHALLDDDGDGVGHYLPELDAKAAPEEGKLARETYLGDGGKRLKPQRRGVEYLQAYNRRLTLDVALDHRTDGR